MSCQGPGPKPDDSLGASRIRMDGERERGGPTSCQEAGRPNWQHTHPQTHTRTHHCRPLNTAHPQSSLDQSKTLSPFPLLSNN